jgi:NADPH:quinone reductase-like Zn-dependent oxidoreductase
MLATLPDELVVRGRGDAAGGRADGPVRAGRAARVCSDSAVPSRGDRRVGWFAAQLATRGGAGSPGCPARGPLIPLMELGAIETAVTSIADADGPFDLVLESTGGPELGLALARLAPGGVVVSYGNSSRAPTSFDVFDFYGRGGASLYGLFLFDELARRGNSGARDLATLAELAATEELVPRISITAPWRSPWPALQALQDRAMVGKAVLEFAG